MDRLGQGRLAGAALLALTLVGSPPGCTGRERADAARARWPGPGADGWENLTAEEKKRAAAAAEVSALVDQGADAYLSGDFEKARQNFDRAAETGGLELRVYPISASAALIPLDRVLLPAVEERFGKFEAKGPGGWLDPDRGYAVLDRRQAEKVAAAFFPVIGETKLFSIHLRAIAASPEEARRWSEKLTGDATEGEWKLDLDSVRAKALEEALTSKKDGFTTVAAHLVHAFDRELCRIRAVSQHSYLSNYDLVTRDGKEVAEPVKNAFDVGSRIDLIPLAGRGSSLRVLVNVWIQHLFEVPKITVALGSFETIGTTRLDVPRVLHWEFYHDLLVHAASPGVLCGQAPAEGAKEDLLWLWIRAEQVDTSERQN
jgi:hypothetical protein